MLSLVGAIFKVALLGAAIFFGSLVLIGTTENMLFGLIAPAGLFLITWSWLIGIVWWFFRRLA